jgi:N-carbamoyl-L-amino-acid hydrolase
MSDTLVSRFVSENRLMARLAALARFGGRPDGGVNRQALSPEEAGARATIVDWGRQIGLIAYTDAAANLFLRLEGRAPDAAPVLAGSHIDSQPTGGRFDGAFGVIAALEAIEAIVANGLRPYRPVEMVAWTNEEGSRFAPGMNGSTAFCRPAELENILSICDADGVTVREAAAAIHAAEPGVAQRPLGRRPHCFIEAHIEQGPLLEEAGIPIGVVTGIQGTRRYRVRVVGEAAHAGTASMETRRDALLSAMRFIRQAEAAALIHPDIKFTVGLFEIEPNAPSVVPAEARFSIDIRHPDNRVVDALDETLRLLAADRGRCAVELSQIAHAPSISFSQLIQKEITAAAETAAIAFMPIFSAAGHDARQLSYVTPTGMIFIPCRDGLSHNPAEWADPAHILAGTRVLTDTIWKLTGN